MPNKPDDQIRKSIKQYEESLPDSERNPHAKEDVEQLIERASQPLPSKRGKPPHPDGYNDTQTRSRNTGDTSDSHSDTFHPENA